MQTTTAPSPAQDFTMLHAAMDSVNELHGVLSEQEITDLLENMSAQMLSNDVLNNLAGLTLREQDALYLKANSLYRQGDYLKAMKLFTILLREDLAESRYFKGIAGCYQMLGEHGKAAAYHGLAYYLDLRDPSPIFHIGQCLLAEGKKREAIEALQMFIDEAKNVSSCRPMLQHAQELMAAVSQLSKREK